MNHAADYAQRHYATQSGNLPRRPAEVARLWQRVTLQRMALCSRSAAEPSALKPRRELRGGSYQRLQTFLHAQPAPGRQTRRCVQAMRACSARGVFSTARLAGAIDMVASARGASIATADRSAAVPAIKSRSLGIQSSLTLRTRRDYAVAGMPDIRATPQLKPEDTRVKAALWMDRNVMTATRTARRKATRRGRASSVGDDPARLAAPHHRLMATAGPTARRPFRSSGYPPTTCYPWTRPDPVPPTMPAAAKSP
jgi:hypothetical protein